MRTTLLIGFVISTLAGAPILLSESAEAQYTTQKGKGWIHKAIHGQKGTVKDKAPKQTKQTKSK